MEQISVEELGRDTAAMVARVQNGETLEITKHGKVIARMVPIVSAQQASVTGGVPI
ncbi:prevent-host-death family protein [Kibdelosporangium banguiense]|uniref:Prevent-host-death family protein n=1 Tax=Kibdelosporangium banguiense TaxID=1365924 RepID=A0ABS4TF40_9PSEU|nr:type II toxin-antitoxin system prevent-host-death family antitoxin [Kibdelosporangium banguiense]MBP2322451.1 prevent-host-death family protein [Kibdelosporangium banguiense]